MTSELIVLDEQFTASVEISLPSDTRQRLTRSNFPTYEPSDNSRYIEELVGDARIIGVVGASFGDEGKGKLTDAVANLPTVKAIARVNSGENAGHTVIHDGQMEKKAYAFHLCPSGILHPDLLNIIGPNCVMDPITFFNDEYGPLLADDHNPSLMVGNTYIVTPGHKLLDLAKNMRANGSTIRGMTFVHADRMFKTDFRLDDIFRSEDELRGKLNKSVAIYETLISQLLGDLDLPTICNEASDRNINLPQHVVEYADCRDRDARIDFLVDLYTEKVKDNEKFPRRGDTLTELRSTLKSGYKIILEGPQSYWLSSAVPTHASSATSADTTFAGIIAAAGVNPLEHGAICLNVTKGPFASRVGAGANPPGFVPQTAFSSNNINSTEDLEGKCTDFPAVEQAFFNTVQDNGQLEGAIYIDEADANANHQVAVAYAIATTQKFGEFGATTKKPRVLGFIDCVAHAVVNETQGQHISISTLDRGDECTKVGLVIAYVYTHDESLQSDGTVYERGKVIEIGDPLPDANILQYCRPIVKVMDGWKETPIAATKRSENDPLPKPVQDYIGAFETFTGFKVFSIGNGPEQNDFIYINRTS